jgi:hypothetical protein
MTWSATPKLAALHPFHRRCDQPIDYGSQGFLPIRSLLQRCMKDPHLLVRA